MLTITHVEKKPSILTRMTGRKKGKPLSMPKSLANWHLRSPTTYDTYILSYLLIICKYNQYAWSRIKKSTNEDKLSICFTISYL